MQRWKKMVTQKNCKHRQNLERDRKLDHKKENEQTSSCNYHKENKLLHKAWANYNRENERYNAKIDLGKQGDDKWFNVIMICYNASNFQPIHEQGCVL